MKGVRFVIMNNVRTVRLGDYEGGFSEAQKRWLEGVTRGCSERELVLATHIPVSQSAGLDSIAAILSSYTGRKLLVSGHTHTVRRHFEEKTGAEEVIAGAACGSWWRGVKGDDGIPYALQNCGAPRGWFIADFSPRGHQLRYQRIGGGEVFSARRMPDGELVVNVFGGSEDASVRLKVRGKWRAMSRYEKPAPEVQDILAANDTLTSAWRRSHRDEFIPLRRLASSHCWSLPDFEAGGTVVLSYKDRSMCFRKRIRL